MKHLFFLNLTFLNLIFLGLIFLGLTFLAGIGTVHAADMRAASIKAMAEYENIQKEAKKSAEQIFKDRFSLEKEIDRVRINIKTLDADIKILNSDIKDLQGKEIKLTAQQSDNMMDLREITGTARIFAKDLESILRQSQCTARFPDRISPLKAIMKNDHFPGMDDFKTISGLFFQEKELSGEVSLYQGDYVDRSGTRQRGDILSIGKFTAAYRTDKETGFLRFSEASGRLAALSGLPAWSVRHNLNKYMNGKSEEVWLDFFGGAALRQITHKLTIMDRITSGGPIAWPIIIIGFFALLIVIERAIFLRGVHTNTDMIMGEVNALALQGQWRECDRIIKDKKGRPVYNVLKAGLGARAEERETLDSILQEAILKELPGLERFLPALNIMGAVAPLLGLLGTVTGMIGTFHVITLYGTGDPRMMSGGISEAMVTTMLGLSVAIPIMLAHTFLSRQVDHIVGDMEEKAVALTNIINREITFID